MSVDSRMRSNTFRFGFTFAFASFCLGGCGGQNGGAGSDAGAVVDDGGGQGGGDQGGGGQGGGGQGGGGGPGGGDMASGPQHYGWVNVASSMFTTTTGTIVSSSAQAGFWQLDGAQSPSTCTITKSGACTLTECPPAGDGGVPLQPSRRSAGAITISGGSRTITLTPGTDGVYPTEVDSANALYAGGETLTFTAAGDAVPAFTDTFLAPAVAQVTSPATPAGNAALPISRDSDFSVSWSGGAAGDVTIGIYPQPTGATITCTFPASAGSGSVPASLLGKLAAGPASYGGFLRATHHLEVSGWSIDLWAYQSILGTSGLTFAGLATLQ